MMNKLNMLRLNLVIILALVSFVKPVKAQDQIYSQFFNSPAYLNPALTGQFKGDLRMNLIYRNQWSALPGDMSYLSASIDYQIPTFGGGIGLIFNRSSEGTAFLKKNNIAAAYSYSVGSHDFVASFGMQAGVTNRAIDYSKLVFGDQLDASLGIYSDYTSAEQPINNNKYYFDAAGGANFVYKNAMLGMALFHINKPDESFTGSKVRLPMRSVVHASYKIPLDGWGLDYEEGSFIIPSVVFYNQSKSNSYSAGLQFKRNNINAGLWYRSNEQGGSDALVVSLIFDIFTNPMGNQKMRLGVSHDATTSRLNYSNTSGTSEVSVGYESTFKNHVENNKLDGRRCYDFY